MTTLDPIMFNSIKNAFYAPIYKLRGTPYPRGNFLGGIIFFQHYNGLCFLNGFHILALEIFYDLNLQDGVLVQFPVDTGIVFSFNNLHALYFPQR
jgi:hypothetical protein